MKITGEMTIFEALRAYPRAADVFKAHAMPCSGCMAMVGESIEKGAHRHGADLEKLLEDLNSLGDNPTERNK
ncbi:MAG: DUF1858 domain-containing protein [Dethiobacter sp.]|nr:DUF1858 domain-containing protein [Dethiobacter sp.]MCL5981328.1 DUF1858 domain-containing protein [Bacillota bacterium]